MMSKMSLVDRFGAHEFVINWELLPSPICDDIDLAMIVKRRIRESFYGKPIGLGTIYEMERYINSVIKRKYPDFQMELLPGFMEV